MMTFRERFDFLDRCFVDGFDKAQQFYMQRQKCAKSNLPYFMRQRDSQVDNHFYCARYVIDKQVLVGGPRSQLHRTVSDLFVKGGQFYWPSKAGLAALPCSLVTQSDIDLWNSVQAHSHTSSEHSPSASFSENEVKILFPFFWQKITDSRNTKKSIETIEDLTRMQQSTLIHMAPSKMTPGTLSDLKAEIDSIRDLENQVKERMAALNSQIAELEEIEANKDPLLTRQEAAEWIKTNIAKHRDTNTDTIEARLSDLGKLKAFPTEHVIGRQWGVRRSEIEKFCKEGVTVKVTDDYLVPSYTKAGTPS